MESVWNGLENWTIIIFKVAVTKYDGTPVKGGGTVTINDVTTSDDGKNQGLTGPQTRVPVDGIVEFEYNIKSTTTNMILTVCIVSKKY